MTYRKLSYLLLLLLAATSCEKSANVNFRYYQVRVTNATADWRDSSFIIATKKPSLIAATEEQLKLPVAYVAKEVKRN